MRKHRLTADLDWEQIAANQAFITGLYRGSAPDRPGCIVHQSNPATRGVPPPAGLGTLERNAWQTVSGFYGRDFSGDDSVPTLGTGAGTCAMATAFGCEETIASGVSWVAPCITGPAQIDHVKKPSVRAGALGGVLAQTETLASCVDERLPIRVMDFQSPFTTVEQMCGSELFFLMPYDEPGRLHALMDLVTDFAIEFFQTQMTLAGPNCCPGIWPSFWFPRCAGIQMSDDNLVNVSPAIYEEFVIPYNNRISEAFGGLFLHSCTITESHVPVLKKLRGLTGINCDISTSVSPALLLDEFGDDVVVAPHAYINTDTNFPDYTAFMRYVLHGWQAGKRLFIYPCTVMYLPATARETSFDEAQVRSVLSEIPSWLRDHGASG